MSEASDLVEQAHAAAREAALVIYEYDPACTDAALRSVLTVLCNPPWGSAEVYAQEMLDVLDSKPQKSTESS